MARVDNEALAAECLVITTGIYPSHPVTPSDAREAAALPRTMAREVAWFIASDRQARPEKSEKIDYLATWRKLNESQDDGALTGALEDPGTGALFLAKLGEARGYLREQWRPTVVSTLTGPVLLSPSLSEQDRCRDLYAIVNNATLLIGRLTSCCVMSEEVAALGAVFPEFTEMVKGLIEAELFRQKLRRKGYELPYRQEVSIRLFAGLPIGSEVQTINAEAAPSPPKLDIATKRDKGEALTRADKIDGGLPA